MTDDQLRFLAGFSRNPDWAQLSMILEGMEAEVLKRLLCATGEQVFQAQGEMRFIHRLRTDITTAAETLERNGALRKQTAARRLTGSLA